MCWRLIWDTGQFNPPEVLRACRCGLDAPYHFKVETCTGYIYHRLQLSWDSPRFVAFVPGLGTLCYCSIICPECIISQTHTQFSPEKGYCRSIPTVGVDTGVGVPHNIIIMMVEFHCFTLKCACVWQWFNTKKFKTKINRDITVDTIQGKLLDWSLFALSSLQPSRSFLIVHRLIIQAHGSHLHVFTIVVHMHW